MSCSSKRGINPIRRAAALAALVLAALIAVLLAPALFGGRTLIPADVLYGYLPWQATLPGGPLTPRNDLLSDLLLQNYPWRQFIRSSLAAGELPLWNPYIFAGIPFFATAQAGVLYPGSLLFLLLPLSAAYTWFFALHLLIGGLGAYAYLRAIRAGICGALLAAVTYGLLGFQLVSVQWPQVQGVVAWLPWGLLCLERTLDAAEEGAAGWRRLALWSAAGAVVAGLQCLSGHPELSLYFLCTLGGCAALRIGLLVARRRFRAAGLAAAAAGGLAVTGTLLAAVQLLPFAELGPLSVRSGAATAEEARAQALPLQQGVALVVPDFFGNPTYRVPAEEVRDSGLEGLGTPARPYPFWGVRNYVEATGYIGVLPLALALAAPLLRRDRHTAFLMLFSVFCLSLVFGTPLYNLFFVVPGFEQIRTPFRWLFPYSACMALLAGRGLDGLLEGLTRRASSAQWRAVGGLALLLTAAGVVGATAVSPAGRGITVDLLGHLATASERVQAAFPSREAFYQFEMPNLRAAAVLLLAGGLALLGAGTAVWLRRRQEGFGFRRGRLVPAIAAASILALTAADLLHFGWGFLSFSDPALLDRRPPVVDWLSSAPEGRVAVYGAGRVLPSNSLMLSGVQDVRGYDSFVPRALTDFWELIEPPFGLVYNQLGAFRQPASLESPLLGLLNVRYIVSDQLLHSPSLVPVYAGELFVYENRRALPRAFAVFDVITVHDRATALATVGDSSFDPGQVVVVEDPDGAPGRQSGARGYVPAQVEAYRPSTVVVSVDMPAAGYLVLADAYAAGWRARDAAGVDLPVLRADGIVRAVRLGPGLHKITFSYAPASLKLGLFVSALAATLLLLATGVALFGRSILRLGHDSSTGRRVVKNTLAPMMTQTAARLVDLGFAVVLLRLLGPAGYGGYAVAVALIGYFGILTDFGIGTLLAREVARSPGAGGSYLSAAIWARLGLCTAATPVLAGLVWLYHHHFGLPSDAAAGALLFMVALFPSGVAAAFSSLFLAHERMEFPAGITLLTTVARALIGTATLLLGWGVAGLGVTSVVTSLMTAGLFWGLSRRLFFPPTLHWEPRLSLQLIKSAVPLVLNSLLNTLFFRVDVLLLQMLTTAQAVGIYATAYKFVDAMLIVPSTLTFALFPVMSRLAAEQDSLARLLYGRGLRVLLTVALPVAVGATVVAEDLIVLLFGEPYRESAAVLQLLVWFLPISYVNGLTQYLLIAMNRQRYITLVFMLGAGVNIAANLVVIPTFGIHGAAAVTVLSELVLLVPFGAVIARRPGLPRIGASVLRTCTAAAIMGGVLLLARGLPLVVLSAAGGVAYAAALAALRAVEPEDRRFLWRVLRPGAEEHAPQEPAAAASPGGESYSAGLEMRGMKLK